MSKQGPEEIINSYKDNRFPQSLPHRTYSLHSSSERGGKGKKKQLEEKKMDAILAKPGSGGWSGEAGE